MDLWMRKAPKVVNTFKHSVHWNDWFFLGFLETFGFSIFILVGDKPLLTGTLDSADVWPVNGADVLLSNKGKLTVLGSSGGGTGVCGFDGTCTLWVAAFAESCESTARAIKTSPFKILVYLLLEGIKTTLRTLHFSSVKSCLLVRCARNAQCFSNIRWHSGQVHINRYSGYWISSSLAAIKADGLSISSTGLGASMGDDVDSSIVTFEDCSTVPGSGNVFSMDRIWLRNSLIIFMDSGLLLELLNASTRKHDERLWVWVGCTVLADAWGLPMEPTVLILIVFGIFMKLVEFSVPLRVTVGESLGVAGAWPGVLKIFVLGGNLMTMQLLGNTFSILAAIEEFEGSWLEIGIFASSDITEWLDFLLRDSTLDVSSPFRLTPAEKVVIIM